MQSGLTIGADKITGTLKYLDSGQLVTDWGAGYFMALKFSNFAAGTTACLVGLDPSVSSGLGDVYADPDHNGVFKVTDKDTQKFIVKTTANGVLSTKRYSLKDLVLEEE